MWKWSNSLLLRFLAPNKKNPVKFSNPSTGEDLPLLNAIWKTLHTVSKMNVMEKMKKDMQRTNVMKKPAGIFRIFTFLLYRWKFQTK